VGAQWHGRFLASIESAAQREVTAGARGAMLGAASHPMEKAGCGGAGPESKTQIVFTAVAR
jgi:hypothetical protein